MIFSKDEQTMAVFSPKDAKKKLGKIGFMSFKFQPISILAMPSQNKLYFMIIS